MNWVATLFEFFLPGCHDKSLRTTGLHHAVFRIRAIEKVKKLLLLTLHWACDKQKLWNSLKVYAATCNHLLKKLRFLWILRSNNSHDILVTRRSLVTTRTQPFHFGLTYRRLSDFDTVFVEPIEAIGTLYHCVAGWSLTHAVKLRHFLNCIGWWVCFNSRKR